MRKPLPYPVETIRHMGRSFVIWLITFALTLAAPAAAFGECCQHSARSSSCCANANKMPGMDRSVMTSGSMMSGPMMSDMSSMDSSASTAQATVDGIIAPCDVSRHSGLPDLVEEAYRQSQRSAQTLNSRINSLRTIAFATNPPITPRSSIAGRSVPPTLLLFDPLSIALRL